MDQTQETNSEGKEITYPKFIQERLDRIPWDELEANYGIRRDFIMNREHIARQLANGQVTDHVRCYARNGSLTVMGPMALQASFRTDKVEVRGFTVNPNPDLSIYGEALRSDKVAERLLDTYDVYVRDGDGNITGKHKGYSYANGGSPITLTRKGADGTEVKTRCLVSFDGFGHNREGEIVRGTQRLFITPCSDVLAYLDNVAPSMYGHEFTPEQKAALSEGKDLYIEDFRTREGKTFDAVVQYNAVSRQVVRVDTPFWRETVKKRTEASRLSAPAGGQQEDRKKEPKKDQEKQDSGQKEGRPKKVHRG